MHILFTPFVAPHQQEDHSENLRHRCSRNGNGIQAFKRPIELRMDAVRNIFKRVLLESTLAEDPYFMNELQHIVAFPSRTWSLRLRFA